MNWAANLILYKRVLSHIKVCEGSLVEATLKLICIAIHFVGIGESLSEIQYWDPTNFHLLFGPFLTIISADHAVITILIVDRHASLNFLVLDFSYLCMLTIQVSCVHAFNLSLRYNYDSHQEERRMRRI